MVVWKKYSSPQAIVYHICQWDGSWWLLYILAVGLSRNGGSPSRLPCSWKTWWSTIVRISNFQTNPWYFLLGWETSWIIQIRFLSMDFWEALFFYNRSSGFLVLKQLHSAGFFHDGNSWHISGAGDFTCDTVTPMPDVLKQISTSHADFVMAGKARHTSCNHCSLILETRSTSIYL